MDNLRDLFQTIYEYPFIFFFFAMFIVSCLGLLTNIRLVYVSIGNKEVIKQIKENKDETPKQN